ncbi:PIG-L family deacetylase [Acidiferrimicrobium sp. IK]|uniref:PIG-L deacetylase family protein n=1 Tax=Acidiferrimicrobium sp. IK TaxID=2871700 RepID=UPI0021CB4292|nr:PIG-L deacetylase family protein [Acidiferrimicrobium sp. IK]MCU4185461.1 PIG-L family deacetylase [Acidiferrimicrobium sp. IK]
MTLTVGPRALGTPEAAWLGSGLLDGLPRWRPTPNGGADARPVERVLVVAPHPDDEVLGPGGAVRLLAARGVTVDVLAVTDGEAAHPAADRQQRQALAERRAGERAEAFRRLGVHPGRLERLGVGDGAVASCEQDLTDAVASRSGPGTLVLAPWDRDGHPDHDATGRAARAGCQRSGAPLMAYLWWAWHWADPSAGAIPLERALRCDLDRRSQAAKRWATAAYRSQIRLDAEHPASSPVLPSLVLRRAWRTFEVYLPEVVGD